MPVPRIERIAASIVALAMLAASAAAGNAAYLCLMDGQVRSSCCCPASEQPEDDACARIERAGGCCEIRDSAAHLPPARFDAAQSLIEPMSLVATLPAGPWAEPSARQDLALPADARAPPFPDHARLFLWNCRYLI